MNSKATQVILITITWIETVYKCLFVNHFAVYKALNYPYPCYMSKTWVVIEYIS